MKFYLNSVKNWGYYDLVNNELMQKYLREIEEETDVKVTFKKYVTQDYQDVVVVDIPSMEVLAQVMKAVGKDLVIEQIEQKDDKYPTICIYDDYME